MNQMVSSIGDVARITGGLLSGRPCYLCGVTSRGVVSDANGLIKVSRRPFGVSKLSSSAGILRKSQGWNVFVYGVCRVSESMLNSRSPPPPPDRPSPPPPPPPPLASPRFAQMSFIGKALRCTRAGASETREDSEEEAGAPAGARARAGAAAAVANGHADADGNDANNSSSAAANGKKKYRPQQGRGQELFALSNTDDNYSVQGLVCSGGCLRIGKFGLPPPPPAKDESEVRKGGGQPLAQARFICFSHESRTAVGSKASGIRQCNQITPRK